MRTLRIIYRSVKYPFSPPTTLLKVGAMILGLAVGALALIGACAPPLAILMFESLGAQMGNMDFSKWDYVPESSAPQWALDESAIYFTSEGWPDDSSSYVVSSDGSELKKLEYVAWPHVSPDGLRMVYSTWRDTDHWSFHIETAKPDGSDRRRLTEDRLERDILPAWSPDGSLIAFARLSDGIFIMAPDGSGLRRVYRLRFSSRGDATDEGIRSGPVWSPDGETLAFMIGEATGASPRYIILTMGADGSDLTRVYVRTPSPEECCRRWLHLAWSPDGGRLAFLNEVPFVVNSDGTGLREAAPGIEESYRDRDSLSWSPDGTRLLLVLSENVYVVEADGGGYERLAAGLPAAWSPDGSRIAVVKKHDGDTQLPAPLLQTMAPDGSDVRVLVERHEDGELRAANPADGWKWPWQR